VPFVAEDRPLRPDVDRVDTLLETRQLLRAVNEVLPRRFGLDLVDDHASED
jgi:hypothetical protein